MAPREPRDPEPVSGVESWRRLSEPARDAHHRAMRAISLMRGGLTLTGAAREAGTSPATVRRYAGEALTRDGTLWRAGEADQLYRRMVITGPDGRVEVDVLGSQQANLIARHSNAIRAYLAGDVDALEPFEGEVVDGVELLTDPDRIEELYRRRELDLDDIYPHT